MILEDYFSFVKGFHILPRWADNFFILSSASFSVGVFTAIIFIGSDFSEKIFFMLTHPYI